MFSGPARGRLHFDLSVAWRDGRKVCHFREDFLECGGKRSATPLLLRFPNSSNHRKRRRASLAAALQGFGSGYAGLRSGSAKMRPFTRTDPRREPESITLGRFFTLITGRKEVIR